MSAASINLFLVVCLVGYITAQSVSKTTGTHQSPPETRWAAPSGRSKRIGTTRQRIPLSQRQSPGKKLQGVYDTNLWLSGQFSQNVYPMGTSDSVKKQDASVVNSHQLQPKMQSGFSRGGNQYSKLNRHSSGNSLPLWQTPGNVLRNPLPPQNSPSDFGPVHSGLSHAGGQFSKLSRETSGNNVPLWQSSGNSLKNTPPLQASQTNLAQGVEPVPGIQVEYSPSGAIDLDLPDGYQPGLQPAPYAGVPIDNSDPSGSAYKEQFRPNDQVLSSGVRKASPLPPLPNVGLQVNPPVTPSDFSIKIDVGSMWYGYQPAHLQGTNGQRTASKPAFQRAFVYNGHNVQGSKQMPTDRRSGPPSSNSQGLQGNFPAPPIDSMRVGSIYQNPEPRQLGVYPSGHSRKSQESSSFQQTVVNNQSAYPLSGVKTVETTSNKITSNGFTPVDRESSRNVVSSYLSESNIVTERMQDSIQENIFSPSESQSVGGVQLAGGHLDHSQNVSLPQDAKSPGLGTNVQKQVQRTSTKAEEITISRNESHSATNTESLHENNMPPSEVLNESIQEPDAAGRNISTAPETSSTLIEGNLRMDTNIPTSGAIKSSRVSSSSSQNQYVNETPVSTGLQTDSANNTSEQSVSYHPMERNETVTIDETRTGGMKPDLSNGSRAQDLPVPRAEQNFSQTQQLPATQIESNLSGDTKGSANVTSRRAESLANIIQAPPQSLSSETASSNITDGQMFGKSTGVVIPTATNSKAESLASIPQVPPPTLSSETVSPNITDGQMVGKSTGVVTPNQASGSPGQQVQTGGLFEPSVPADQNLPGGQQSRNMYMYGGIDYLFDYGTGGQQYPLDHGNGMITGGPPTLVAGDIWPYLQAVGPRVNTEPPIVGQDAGSLLASGQTNTSATEQNPSSLNQDSEFLAEQEEIQAEKLSEQSEAPVSQQANETEAGLDVEIFEQSNTTTVPSVDIGVIPIKSQSMDNANMTAKINVDIGVEAQSNPASSISASDKGIRPGEFTSSQSPSNATTTKSGSTHQQTNATQSATELSLRSQNTSSLNPISPGILPSRSANGSSKQTPQQSKTTIKSTIDSGANQTKRPSRQNINVTAEQNVESQPPIHVAAAESHGVHKGQRSSSISSNVQAVPTDHQDSTITSPGRKSPATLSQQTTGINSTTNPGYLDIVETEQNVELQNSTSNVESISTSAGHIPSNNQTGTSNFIGENVKLSTRQKAVEKEPQTYNVEPTIVKDQTATVGQVNLTKPAGILDVQMDNKTDQSIGQPESAQDSRSSVNSPAEAHGIQQKTNKSTGSTEQSGVVSSHSPNRSLFNSSGIYHESPSASDKVPNTGAIQQNRDVGTSPIASQNSASPNAQFTNNSYQRQVAPSDPYNTTDQATQFEAQQGISPSSSAEPIPPASEPQSRQSYTSPGSSHFEPNTTHSDVQDPKHIHTEPSPSSSMSSTVEQAAMLDTAASSQTRQDSLIQNSFAASVNGSSTQSGGVDGSETIKSSHTGIPSQRTIIGYTDGMSTGEKNASSSNLAGLPGKGYSYNTNQKAKDMYSSTGTYSGPSGANPDQYTGNTKQLSDLSQDSHLSISNSDQQNETNDIIPEASVVGTDVEQRGVRNGSSITPGSSPNKSVDNALIGTSSFDPKRQSSQQANQENRQSVDGAGISSRAENVLPSGESLPVPAQPVNNKLPTDTNVLQSTEIHGTLQKLEQLSQSGTYPKEANIVQAPPMLNNVPNASLLNPYGEIAIQESRPQLEIYPTGIKAISRSLQPANNIEQVSSLANETETFSIAASPQPASSGGTGSQQLNSTGSPFEQNVDVENETVSQQQEVQADIASEQHAPISQEGPLDQGSVTLGIETENNATVITDPAIDNTASQARDHFIPNETVLQEQEVQIDNATERSAFYSPEGQLTIETETTNSTTHGQASTQNEVLSQQQFPNELSALNSQVRPLVDIPYTTGKQTDTNTTDTSYNTIGKVTSPVQDDASTQNETLLQRQEVQTDNIFEQSAVTLQLEPELTQNETILQEQEVQTDNATEQSSPDVRVAQSPEQLFISKTETTTNATYGQGQASVQHETLLQEQEIHIDNSPGSTASATLPQLQGSVSSQFTGNDGIGHGQPEVNGYPTNNGSASIDGAAEPTINSSDTTTNTTQSAVNPVIQMDSNDPSQLFISGPVEGVAKNKTNFINDQNQASGDQLLPRSNGSNIGTDSQSNNGQANSATQKSLLITPSVFHVENQHLSDPLSIDSQEPVYAEIASRKALSTIHSGPSERVALNQQGNEQVNPPGSYGQQSYTERDNVQGVKTSVAINPDKVISNTIADGISGYQIETIANDTKLFNQTESSGSIVELGQQRSDSVGMAFDLSAGTRPNGNDTELSNQAGPVDSTSGAKQQTSGVRSDFTMSSGTQTNDGNTEPFNQTGLSGSGTEKEQQTSADVTSGLILPDGTHTNRGSTEMLNPEVDPSGRVTGSEHQTAGSARNDFTNSSGIQTNDTGTELFNSEAGSTGEAAGSKDQILGGVEAYPILPSGAQTNGTETELFNPEVNPRGSLTRTEHQTSGGLRIEAVDNPGIPYNSFDPELRSSPQAYQDNRQSEGRIGVSSRADILPSGESPQQLNYQPSTTLDASNILKSKELHRAIQTLEQWSQSGNIADAQAPPMLSNIPNVVLVKPYGEIAVQESRSQQEFYPTGVTEISSSQYGRSDFNMSRETQNNTTETEMSHSQIDSNPSVTGSGHEKPDGVRSNSPLLHENIGINTELFSGTGPTGNIVETEQHTSGGVRTDTTLPREIQTNGGNVELLNTEVDPSGSVTGTKQQTSVGVGNGTQAIVASSELSNQAGLNGSVAAAELQTPYQVRSGPTLSVVAQDNGTDTEILNPAMYPSGSVTGTDREVYVGVRRDFTQSSDSQTISSNREQFSQAGPISSVAKTEQQASGGVRNDFIQSPSVQRNDTKTELLNQARPAGSVTESEQQIARDLSSDLPLSSGTQTNVIDTERIKTEIDTSGRVVVSQQQATADVSSGFAQDAGTHLLNQEVRLGTDVNVSPIQHSSGAENGGNNTNQAGSQTDVTETDISIQQASPGVEVSGQQVSTSLTGGVGGDTGLFNNEVETRTRLDVPTQQTMGKVGSRLSTDRELLIQETGANLGVKSPGQASDMVKYNVASEPITNEGTTTSGNETDLLNQATNPRTIINADMVTGNVGSEVFMNEGTVTSGNETELFNQEATPNTNVEAWGSLIEPAEQTSDFVNNVGGKPIAPQGTRANDNETELLNQETNQRTSINAGIATGNVGSESTTINEGTTAYGNETERSNQEASPSTNFDFRARVNEPIEQTSDFSNNVGGEPIPPQGTRANGNGTELLIQETNQRTSINAGIVTGNVANESTMNEGTTASGNETDQSNLEASPSTKVDVRASVNEPFEQTSDFVNDVGGEPVVPQGMRTNGNETERLMQESTINEGTTASGNETEQSNQEASPSKNFDVRASVNEPIEQTSDFVNNVGVNIAPQGTGANGNKTERLIQEANQRTSINADIVTGNVANESTMNEGTTASGNETEQSNQEASPSTNFDARASVNEPIEQTSDSLNNVGGEPIAPQGTRANGNKTELIIQETNQRTSINAGIVTGNVGSESTTINEGTTAYGNETQQSNHEASPSTNFDARASVNEPIEQTSSFVNNVGGEPIAPQGTSTSVNKTELLNRETNQRTSINADMVSGNVGSEAITNEGNAASGNDTELSSNEATPNVNVSSLQTLNLATYSVGKDASMPRENKSSVTDTKTLNQETEANTATAVSVPAESGGTNTGQNITNSPGSQIEVLNSGLDANSEVELSGQAKSLTTEAIGGGVISAETERNATLTEVQNPSASVPITGPQKNGSAADVSVSRTSAAERPQMPHRQSGNAPNNSSQTISSQLEHQLDVPVLLIQEGTNKTGVAVDAVGVNASSGPASSVSSSSGTREQENEGLPEVEREGAGQAPSTITQKQQPGSRPVQTKAPSGASSPAAGGSVASAADKKQAPVSIDTNSLAQSVASVPSSGSGTIADSTGGAGIEATGGGKTGSSVAPAEKQASSSVTSAKQVPSSLGTDVQPSSPASRGSASSSAAKTRVSLPFEGGVKAAPLTNDAAAVNIGPESSLPSGAGRSAPVVVGSGTPSSSQTAKDTVVNSQPAVDVALVEAAPSRQNPSKKPVEQEPSPIAAPVAVVPKAPALSSPTSGRSAANSPASESKSPPAVLNPQSPVEKPSIPATESAASAAKPPVPVVKPPAPAVKPPAPPAFVAKPPTSATTTVEAEEIATEGPPDPPSPAQGTSSASQTKSSGSLKPRPSYRQPSGNLPASAPKLSPAEANLPAPAVQVQRTSPPKAPVPATKPPASATKTRPSATNPPTSATTTVEAEEIATEGPPDPPSPHGSSGTSQIKSSNSMKPNRPYHPCDRCVVINGIGYNRHRTNCQLYYQCIFRGTLVSPVVRSCPTGQFWDQKALTCQIARKVQCAADPCLDRLVDNYQHGDNCILYWQCQNRRTAGVVCCRPGFSYLANVGCVASYSCQDQCPAPAPAPQPPPQPRCNKVPYNGDRTRYIERVSGYRPYVRYCPRGTAFDPDTCSCVYVRRPRPARPPPPQPRPAPRPTPRPFRPQPQPELESVRPQGEFEVHQHDQSQPDPNNENNNGETTMDAGGPEPQEGIARTPLCRPSIYLPFDYDTKDYSGNNVAVHQEGVLIDRRPGIGAVGGGAAYFNGASKVSIWRFANAHFGRTFQIKFRYREIKGPRTNTPLQGLVTNSDCRNTGSLAVAYNQQTGGTYSHVVTDEGGRRILHDKHRPAWKNVELTSDGTDIQLQVNGEGISTDLLGAVSPIHPALHVGYGCSSKFEYFTGYIDEVYVYLCVP